MTIAYYYFQRCYSTVINKNKHNLGCRMLELHKKRSSWNEFLKAQRWLLGRDAHFFITTSKFWLRLESFHQTILGWVFVKCSFFTRELFAITKESLFFREVLQTLNLWPKFGHPNHILRLEFAKTILILQKF